jgi:tRNA(fMet)-specific endonuclease VapC
MIVLDTDSLGILQRASGGEFERLAARLRSVPDWPFYVTIVTFEEQMRGWLASVARAKTPQKQIVAYARLRRLVDDFRTRPILDFDEHAMTEFQRLVKSKVRIGTMDLRIAAIVLSHGAKLISRNLVDFRKVPGLMVEDWVG